MFNELLCQLNGLRGRLKIEKYGICTLGNIPPTNHPVCQYKISLDIQEKGMMWEWAWFHLRHLYRRVQSLHPQYYRI
jgi:hypothetical protein